MKPFNIHTGKSYRHLQQKMCNVFEVLAVALAFCSVSLNAQEIDINTPVSKVHRSVTEGFDLKPFFYTADDGGLVFASSNVGAKTSKNTKYARAERREMLRSANTRIITRGLTKNNWVFGGADGDYVQATFYHIHNMHNRYKF